MKYYCGANISCFYRETFPVLEQFNIITRFIIDQSQTPNLKVCVIVDVEV